MVVDAVYGNCNFSAGFYYKIKYEIKNGKNLWPVLGFNYTPRHFLIETEQFFSFDAIGSVTKIYPLYAVEAGRNRHW